jgi:hypothetical protein
LQRPTSCIAFTIRAWSRRTSQWTARQSMAHQSTSRWTTAPAGVSAVICIVSLIGLPSSLVKKDHDGSLPAFAWGDLVRVNSTPIHLITRWPSFSIFLCPHPHRLPLRVAFPDGRSTGLPRSTLKPSHGLGSAYSPVARHLR